LGIIINTATVTSTTPDPNPDNNAGPSNANNVVLTDDIPLEILGPEFSIDGGVTWNPWTGIYNIGTLISGTTRVILIRGTVSPNATGVISNTATVTSTTPDPDSDNNSSTVDVDVEINGVADISVEKNIKS
jgi:hypothetical protein